MGESVELAPGTDNNGFAQMLAGLVRQNLEDHPEKRATFNRILGRVALVPTDVETAVTLRFHGGTLTLYDGIVGIPDVTIRATSDQLMKLSLLENTLPLGLPDPRGENVREILRGALKREIQIFGLLPNLPLLMRLSRVLSVN